MATKATKTKAKTTTKPKTATKPKTQIIAKEAAKVEEKVLAEQVEVQAVAVEETEAIAAVAEPEAAETAAAPDEPKKEPPAALPPDYEREAVEEVQVLRSQEDEEFLSRVMSPRPVLPTIKLPWIINDFTGISENVYEGAMVAAIRARQIGRRQKQEIERFDQHREKLEVDGEEISNPGVDHFNHTKPTVQALQELGENRVKFSYTDQGKEK